MSERARQILEQLLTDKQLDQEKYQRYLAMAEKDAVL